AATRAQVDRGRRLPEMLKQGQYGPLSVERQVLVSYGGITGYIDKLPVSSIRQYDKESFAHGEDKHPKVFVDLRTRKEVSGHRKERIDALLKAFTEKFVPSETKS